MQQHQLETIVNEYKSKTNNSEVNSFSTYFDVTDFQQYKKSELMQEISCLENFIQAGNSLSFVPQTLLSEATLKLSEAMETLEQQLYTNPYSEDDLNLLAYMVFIEAGDSRISDEEQQLVAQVILNRVQNGGINGNLLNPNISDIVNERGQYSIAMKYNYNINANNIDLSKITERCYQNARLALEGNIICPSNVLYQATFKQGHGVYKSFYHDAPYYNTTYFCFA